LGHPVYHKAEKQLALPQSYHANAEATVLKYTIVYKPMLQSTEVIEQLRLLAVIFRTQNSRF